MKNQKSIQNKSFVPATHYFIYQNKQYPIKFPLFVFSSKYFEKQQYELSNIKFIPLLDPITESRIIMTDDIIINFIKYCEGESITINYDNVFELNYLSTKYAVPALKESISDFIDENHQDLSIQFLTNPITADSQETEQYEDILSRHLSSYIDDENLCKLKVSVILRILTKFKSQKNIEKIENEKMISFLFKCLDEHGMDASILFSLIDFGIEKFKVVKRLIDSYKENFDFSMINSNLAETYIQLISDVKRQNEEYNKAFREMKETISDQQNQVDQLKKQTIQIEEMYKQKLDDQEKFYLGKIESIKEVYEQKVKNIEEKYELLNQEQIKLSDKSVILKYQQFILENLTVDQFNNLGEESKKFLIDKIFENLQRLQFNYKKFKTDFFRSFLTINRIYDCLSQKELINIEDYSKAKFIQTNLQETTLKFEIIKDLYSQSYLTEIINDLMFSNVNLSIEILYPSDIFEDVVNLITNFKIDIENEQQIDTAKKRIQITINIDEDEYPESNYKLNLNYYLNKIKDLIKEIKSEILIGFSPDTKILEKIDIFSKMTTIIIPNTITVIKSKAFYNCSSIKQIFIPTSVTSIEGQAFDGCKSLTKLFIPSSVITIGDNAFISCESLTEITLSPKLTILDEQLLCKCSSLKEIQIPLSVISIKNNVFIRCTSLTQIEIPSSVESIGDYAFQNCSSLVKITIPSSVKSIGQYAFSKCTSLMDINLPPSLKTIEINLFWESSSLKEITIPSSVTSIKNNAFHKCSSITEIVIPSSVESIGDSVFRDCTSLIRITIPSSVKSIGSYAFNNCTSLIDIKLPNSISKINNNSFLNCKSLEIFSVPSSVSEIGDDAFSGCSSLKQISIASDLYINRYRIGINQNAKIVKTNYQHTY